LRDCEILKSTSDDLNDELCDLQAGSSFNKSVAFASIVQIFCWDLREWNYVFLVCVEHLYGLQDPSGFPFLWGPSVAVSHLAAVMILDECSAFERVAVLVLVGGLWLFFGGDVGVVAVGRE